MVVGIGKVQRRQRIIRLALHFFEDDRIARADGHTFGH